VVFATPWQAVYGTGIESARHYGKHWHATYGLGLLEHGAQRSASGRGSVDAYAGDLIATNPGEVHDGRPLGGALRRWRIVYFEPGVMASMAGRADVEVTCPVIRDAALRRALQGLFAALQRWRDGGDAEVLACDEALVQVCGLVLDRHATGTPLLREAPADVTRARDRLADDLLNPPTLAELAAMAGLSKYQLLRRFRQAYGVPPHAWLMAQRVERARVLIRAGASLAHAAASSGFADQSHLTRVFVRQFGFTPGAWRRAQ